MAAALPPDPAGTSPGAASETWIQQWRLVLAVFVTTAVAYGGVIFGLFPYEPFLKYPTLARQALEGTLSPERRLDLSPLYLGFHELLAAVGAPAGTAELLQILAVALATALLASLLRPRVGLGPTLVACGLFTAGGGLVTYTATLEPEAFLVLAVTVFLWAVLGTPRRPAVAGLALAVAGILRPNLLPLAVLVPLGFWLEARRGDAEERRRARRAALLVALPALVAVAALLSRNATLPGPFTPFVMNPGTVFFEGNHPWAEGTAATYPPLFPELIPHFAGSPDPQHELYRLLARRASGEELTVAQVNGFWRARAWSFLVDHPGLTLKRVGRKFVAVLGGYSWHDLPTAHWNERRLGWPVLWASGLLLALALWGLERAVIGLRQSWPLLLLGALQLAVLLTVYASARQRLALWPVAAILAGWALAPTTVRRFSRRSILVWTALLFLVTTLLRSEGAFDRHLFSAVETSSRLAAEARAERAAGRLDEAATRAAQAFVAAPWRVEALHPAYVPGIAEALARELDRAEHLPPFERGLLALAAGRTESASASFVLAALEPRRFEGTDSSEPFYYQALVLHRRGAPAAEVAGVLAAGLRETPGDPEILAALAVLGAEGQPREALFRYWDPLTANFFLGRQALRFDRREACFEPLQFVHERLPEFRRGAIHLAACLGAVGRPEEGARVFVEANRKVQEPLVLEAEILGLFRDLVTRHPDDPATLRLAAAAHRQYGRTPEALALLERLAAVTGGSDPSVGESLRQVRATLGHGSSEEATVPVIFTWTDQLVNSLPLERRAVEARTGVALDPDRGNTNPYFDVFVGHGTAGSGLERVELRQAKKGASRLGGLVIFDLDPAVSTIDHRQIPARFGPDFAFEPPAAGPRDAPAYYLYRRPWGELRFGWHRGTGRLLVVVIDAA